MENWNRKIKEAKCGKVETNRRAIYVGNCEKNTGNKI